ncbi:SDR family NAD(P)-dependent oxidoreductase [Anaerosporobacter sp.]|uniref:SDR family NAD(P)-dependent oxidoreductase n=1 Tax=Anaerosporobacter sp. TaxID=1872529 RepID=UPI00286FAE7F|nr:SDR family oxidoreductase [Anaerosporobacter sp.]
MKKVVLITGVSRNIGKSICRKFLSEGYQVIGTYNTSKSIAEQLEKEYSDLTLYQVDFCDENSTTVFIEKMKEYRFDVIVNNAGTMNLTEDDEIVHEFRNFSLPNFEAVMRCNFYAPMRICIELQDYINTNGTIVNIASTDGMLATYASLSYSASKAALINVSKSLGNNFYPKSKVRVISISPGWIMADDDSSMGSDENSAGGKAGILSPIGRNGYTTEIAEKVYEHVVSKSILDNGNNYVYDGGFTNYDVIYWEEANGVSLLRDITEVKKDMEAKGE